MGTYNEITRQEMPMFENHESFVKTSRKIFQCSKFIKNERKNEEFFFGWDVTIYLQDTIQMDVH